ncbi:MAG: HdeA/HdeB family chaperone [Beijerinckiaceae bacterium]
MKASTGMVALVAFFWPALLAAPLAQAEQLDLDTVKCKVFLENSKENIAYTLAWLDGYYKGEDDPAVIDFDKLKENAATLGTYCAQHPDATIATAAEELFGK